MVFNVKKQNCMIFVVIKKLLFKIENCDEVNFIGTSRGTCLMLNVYTFIEDQNKTLEKGLS